MNQDEQRASEKGDKLGPKGSKYPWYVYLIGGYSLTGLFAWYLMAQQFWYRNRRPLAAGVIGLNAAILVAVYWLAMKVNITWWRFETVLLVFNLAWSISAWCTQRWVYGPCERRLMTDQWKKWLTPMVVAMTLGAAVVVVTNILPAVGERFTAMYTEGASPRSLVLWEFFHNLPMGLFIGALIGLWWAGERHYTTRHISAFLFGICLVAVVQLPTYTLFIYLVHGANFGQTMLNGDAWELVPYGSDGLRNFLITLGKFDYGGILVVGLLFGAPDRIRLFFKRAAVIIPMITILSLPMLLFSQEGWKLIQGQIVYQLSSPEQHHRDTAFSWLEVMLNRFPNHSNWPYLALRLADDQYEKGDIGGSQKHYNEIIERFGKHNEWKDVADKSRAMLSSPNYGKKQQGKSLKIPLVSYQSHLTQNWMALLSNLRFLNGPQIPESDITIRLMDISNSEHRIDLPNLSDLADLDDAARSLDYEVLLMPSSPDTARRLIENDIPVLLPVFRTFYLLYGFDDAARVVKAYCFGQLSAKLKHRATDEATEILMLEAEANGDSEKRNQRIAQEAQCQWPYDQWKEKAFTDAAPLMAVIYPKERQPLVDRVLGNTTQYNTQRSQGYLAALIGLSFAHRGDPMNCLQWARRGAQRVSASMPLHVAHVGQSLWATRTRKIGASIGIEKKFSVLDAPVAFFDDASTVAFAEQARERFTLDLQAGNVPWNIRHMLVSLLDQTDPKQRAQIIELVQYGLARHPSDRKQWLRLVSLYELEGDLDAVSTALEGACSAGKWDVKTQLSLAAVYTRMGRMDRVRDLLKHMDPQKVSYEADYPYCLGAVAEADGRAKAALGHYANAIDMCRYRPDYHLRYAKLLMDQGDSGGAEKALAWAARIDSGEIIRKEAMELLSKIQ